MEVFAKFLDDAGFWSSGPADGRRPALITGLEGRDSS